MAAPEYVPLPAGPNITSYESPPRRPSPWKADRPGDIPAGFPRGDMLGSPGPDQGYVYVLVRHFDGRLQLTPGEHEADVVAGGATVALKRASLFRRAPIMHDLTVAFTVWGFLREAPDDLVELRSHMFAEVSYAHAYEDMRRLVDAVPESTLRLMPEKAAEAHAKDWRSLLDL